MPWYAIQTYTGREEQLVSMIRCQVPKECCGECFVAYYEQIRDRKQENQIHILRLFPGYIFIFSEDVELLFRCLKMLPAMAKIMTAGAFAFTPLYEEEAEFLLQMMDPDHIVRLTYVATDGKDHISCLSGPMERCRNRIVNFRFRDRYARVRMQIAGQEKIVRVGIILNDDVRRETAYGKVEALIPRPDKYEVPVSKEPGTQLKTGDRVAVVGGAFEGNAAVISHVGKHTVKIAVRMFGRDIQLEIPAGDVRKLA